MRDNSSCGHAGSEIMTMKGHMTQPGMAVYNKTVLQMPTREDFPPVGRGDTLYIDMSKDTPIPYIYDPVIGYKPLYDIEKHDSYVTVSDFSDNKDYPDIK